MMALLILLITIAFLSLIPAAYWLWLTFTPSKQAIAIKAVFTVIALSIGYHAGLSAMTGFVLVSLFLYVFTWSIFDDNEINPTPIRQDLDTEDWYD